MEKEPFPNDSEQNTSRRHDQHEEHVTLVEKRDAETQITVAEIIEKLSEYLDPEIDIPHILEETADLSPEDAVAFSLNHAATVFIMQGMEPEEIFNVLGLVEEE